MANLNSLFEQFFYTARSLPAEKDLCQSISYQCIGAHRISASGRPDSVRLGKMSKKDVTEILRDRKRSTDSVEEQITIVHAMWDTVGPSHDGIKADDIEDELDLDLDYKIRTSLGHLKEGEVGLVEEFLPPGPETLAIAEWKDGGEGEIVNGEVEEAAREGVNGLIDDLDLRPESSEGSVTADGRGSRADVVAAEFDLLPDKIEEFLKSTSEPVEVLNRAVDALEEEELGTSDDYGKIAFINMPYRYRLTDRAVALLQ